MKTLTLNIPENLNLDDQELLMMLAAKLYEEKKLFLGQAAKLAGVSKRVFAELLGNFNVSIFNYSADELSKDVDNA
ncbi:MAG TPA: UPF0175 family protein [Flavobacteriaceae bacterium]|nr:UPF0175 family protein [Flavobacteriaceae bacterium]